MGKCGKKISVILAAYRGEKYIGAQLRSLFAQTRPPDEILIGDDSPDALTRTAITAVLPEKPPAVGLRIIVNAPRLGHYRNFENLLRLADGDLIFFCDQDDIWLPEKIEILAALLARNPHKMLVFCDSVKMNADLTRVGGNLLPTKNQAFFVNEINGGRAFPATCFRGFGLSAHNVAIRGKFKTKLLPFPADHDCQYADQWLIAVSSLFEVMYCFPQVMTKYRVHSDNASKPAWNFWGRWSSLLVRPPIAEFRKTIAIFRALREKFAPTEGENLAVNLAEVKRRIAYYESRIKIVAKRRIMRILPIWRLRNEYFQVGIGWKSIVRDFLSPIDREKL